ncbi:MAG: hypothetical protein KH415_20660 [Clostridium sp.]|nr:hypothetical protein [Clostridium sp.]
MGSTIINTKDALDKIISKLESNQGSFFLLDNKDGSMIALDNGAIHLLKSYYKNKFSKFNKEIING